MNEQTTQYHEDAGLIDALGGPAEVARKLGFELPKGIQRVQNWKYRGIPEIERLRNPAVFVYPEAGEEVRDAA